MNFSCCLTWFYYSRPWLCNNTLSATTYPQQLGRAFFVMNLFLAGNPSFPKYFKCFMWTEERAIQKPTNVDRVLDTNKVIIILTAYKTPSSCKSLSLPDVNKKKIGLSTFPFINIITKWSQNMIKPLLANTPIRSLHPTASCKWMQHCRPTAPNIVECMLHPLAHPVAMLLQCCCMLLGVVTQTFSHVQMDTTILSLAHI